MMNPRLIVPEPCRKCSCRAVDLADDSRMTCRRCREARGTLDAGTFRFIRGIEENFGPVAEPIVLRGKDSTRAKSDRHLVNLAALECTKGRDAA